MHRVAHSISLLGRSAGPDPPAGERARLRLVVRLVGKRSV